MDAYEREIAFRSGGTHALGCGWSFHQGWSPSALQPRLQWEDTVALLCVSGGEFAYFSVTGESNGSRVRRASELTVEGDAAAAFRRPLSCPHFLPDEEFEARPLEDFLTLQSFHWNGYKPILFFFF